MKRAYEVNLDGTVYRLRLTAGAQKRLIKQYGQQATQVCMDAFGDLDKLCMVLNELLHWSGSGNSELSGEAFCDLLVDEGYALVSDVPELVLRAMAESGLLTESQLTTILNQLHGAVDAALDSLGDGEENPTTAAG
ncbi:MAG: hypothetical protein LUD83_01880 [Clostridiales bacterium]|nr:hypothetical protein [Clostridiales bacterium]